MVNDAELSSLNIKDLNRKLKEKGLTKETIEKLKQRRRTLKNRKYATEYDFTSFFSYDAYDLIKPEASF